jgi:hypothetical protein
VVENFTVAINNFIKSVGNFTTTSAIPSRQLRMLSTRDNGITSLPLAEVSTLLMEGERESR